MLYFFLLISWYYPYPTVTIKCNKNCKNLFNPTNDRNLNISIPYFPSFNSLSLVRSIKLSFRSYNHVRLHYFMYPAGAVIICEKKNKNIYRKYLQILLRSRKIKFVTFLNSQVNDNIEGKATLNKKKTLKTKITSAFLLNLFFFHFISH